MNNKNFNPQDFAIHTLPNVFSQSSVNPTENVLIKLLVICVFLIGFVTNLAYAESDMTEQGNISSGSTSLTQSDFSNSSTIPTSYATSDNKLASFNNSAVKSSNPDQMALLIEQKSQEYHKNAEAFYSSYSSEAEDYSSSNTHWQGSSDFGSWYGNYYNKQRADAYQLYLEQRVGKENVPPLSQMLLTARSWSQCGASPYEVPPNYLWGNMVSTLRLYSELKRQKVLPENTVIRSVYRNPQLNRCARGASSSRHKANSALDLWVPDFDYDLWMKRSVQNDMCDFWLFQGQKYSFGLGLYSTGSIHIDTQGYRKWGSGHSASSSPCRYG